MHTLGSRHEVLGGTSEASVCREAGRWQGAGSSGSLEGACPQALCPPHLKGWIILSKQGRSIWLQQPTCSWGDHASLVAASSSLQTH